MTITDAGPLIALADAADPDHEVCVRTLRGLSLPLVTTWAAYTEAMYLIGRELGWLGQVALWRIQQRRSLLLADLSPAGTARAAELMSKYHDRPTDLADATLVALAEERDEPRIFTLDAGFHVYRLHGRRTFEVVPS